MMMTADTRTYQLIQRLFETKGFVKLEELTASFRLSDRSIRNLIKEANELLTQAGAMIKTIRGKGYTLLTSDQDAFLLWLHQQKLPARSRTRHARRAHTIYDEKTIASIRLLKIDQLAEELFISRMTVSSDLKRTGAVSPLRYDPCLKAWIWLKSRRRRIAKGRATQTYCLKKNPPYLI